VPPEDPAVCNLRLTSEQGPANEFDVADDPGDPCTLVVGGNDYVLRVGDERSGDDDHEELSEDVWAGHYTTHDCGRTWSEGLVPGYPGGPEETALSPYEAAGDPVVFADEQGRFYYVGIAFNRSPTEGSIFVAESTDGGETFDETSLVHDNDQGLDDKPWATVDPQTGDLFVTWTMFGGEPGGVVFAKSTDGDLDFTEPERLCQSSCGQGSQVIVAPDDTLHVVWASTSQGQLWYTRSTDRGESWTEPEVIARYDMVSWRGEAPFRTPTLPILAVDRTDGHTRGNLYVTVQARGAGSDAFLASSTDGGDTWSDLTRVNENALGDQFFPTVDVGPYGDVQVMWMDVADDDTIHHRMATSRDAGTSFEDHQRLTTAPSQAHDFMGDYQGIAATERAVHPAFIDTRDDRREAFSALRTLAPQVDLGDAEAPVRDPVELEVAATPRTTLSDVEVTLRVPAPLDVADPGEAEVARGEDATTLTWTREEVLRETTVALEAAIQGPEPGTWTATATVAGTGLAGDRVEASATAELTLLAPELAADTEVPSDVDAGEGFAARLEVANEGNLAADPGHANLTVPEGYLLEPGTVTVGTEGAGMVYGEPDARPRAPQNPATRPATTVTWDLPALAPGEDTRYALGVRAPADVVLEPRTSTFDAAALAGDGSGYGERTEDAAVQTVRPLVPGPLAG
jgi:hypothetical protein